MRAIGPALVLALWAMACGSGGSSPSTPAAPSPAPSPSPSPSPSPAVFSISLPVRAGETANAAFGLNPFGIHIGDHGIDGHPGWDIEYVPGGTVIAAADGTIQSVIPSEGGGMGIQLTHTVNGRDAYRTIYGVGTLAPGVVAGARIAAKQPLGTVGTYTRTIGTITVTYGFTHFQLDDFSRNVGQTNQNASPIESFLDAEARQLFQAIWRDAFYPQELVEPFVTNPRDVSFPMTRTWTQTSGALAARIEFTRATAFASTFSYVLRDAGGNILERGTVEIEALAKPAPTIDFIADSGARRRGVYSILDGTMQMAYGAPGAARPGSLASASTYTTTP